MKPNKQFAVVTLVAAALLGGGPSTWASGLSTDALHTGDGRIMADVSTYAGSGEFNDLNGAALEAGFRSPSRLAQLPDGSIVAADTRNHVIRKISGGKVTTYAGPEAAVFTSSQGFPMGSLLDGFSSESFFNEPAGLAVDDKGNVYVADAGNNAIRKIDVSGRVSTLAGSGVMGKADGSNATFNHPSDIAVTKEGVLYVADALNHAIRKITPDGVVSTLNAPSTRAIRVAPGQAVLAGEYQDGRLSSAKFNEPSGLVLDNKGNLFVSDTGNQRIRYIDLQAGIVTTVAGTTSLSESGAQFGANELYAAGDYVDGEALQAKFDFPMGLAITPEGGLLIADSLNHAIRYLLNGKVSTIAGKAVTGETDGVEKAAKFYNPTGVLLTQQGNMVVADAFNNKIRLLTPYHLPLNLPNDDQVKVVQGDKVIEFDAQPEIQAGRTMVPVRAISEALGYTVKYVEQDGKSVVQLTKGTVAIELTIGQTGLTRKEAGKADVKRETDAAPYVKQDRTFVPVRFFAEQIGMDVEWNAAHQTAILRVNSFVK